MSQFFSRTVLPLLLCMVSLGAHAQDEKETWGQWYSESLGVLFISMGTPVEEVIEFKGPLGEKAKSFLAVAFNAGEAEFSVVRIKLKPGETVTPREALDHRLAVPKAKAPDFKVKEEKELLESNYPCVHAWAEYTGPDEAPVSRRILTVGHGTDLWIMEVVGLTTLEAREAANKFFDSVRMDLEGKIKPGDKKLGG